MWNKDLKNLLAGIPAKNMCIISSNNSGGKVKSVYTYKETPPGPLWESIAAFVVGVAAMVAVWLVLAVLTV